VKETPDLARLTPKQLASYEATKGMFFYLEEGDTFQEGDIYEGHVQPFHIGSRETSLKPGDKVPAAVMCYAPRRYKAVEVLLRKLDSIKSAKEIKPSVKEAMDVLSEAIMADITPGSYGYSWICNIAMPLWDQRDKLDLKEPADCNKMAEILLRHFFQTRLPDKQTYPEKSPTPP
jgi:hypothetical protein